MIRNILAAIFIIGIVSSCSDKAEDNFTGYIVSGTFLNGAGSQVFLEEVNGDNITVIDTAMLDDKGSFSMRGYVLEKSVCVIRANNTRYVLLVVENNSRINVTGDLANLANYAASGSSDTKSLKGFIDNLTVRRNGLTSIPQQYNAAINQPGADPEAVRMEYEMKYKELNRQVDDFVKAYVDTAPPAMAIFATNMIDVNKEYAYLKTFAERLSKEAPGSKFTAPFLAKIKSMGATAVGSEAPAIELPDPEGKIIGLASTRGSIVLVDFWASWCGPCRQENPNLIMAYKRFKDKGFKIYSVSLDNDKSRWVKAIRDDKLEWSEHVSELVPQRWQDRVMASYNFNSIPSSFLLDKNGVIIAKNLRGQDLVAKLEELFNEG